jgi:iron-sulfur cluster repair protein YtfE (RIC family)
MSAQQSSKTGNEQIIALLAQDHRKILALFEQFQRIRGGNDSNGKQMLAEILCTELVIHAQVEQDILYPALRRALDEKKLLDEAEVEHRMAARMVSELELMDPEDALYDAELAVLCTYVSHHIQEEESLIFPKISEAPLDDATVDALKNLRSQLRNEFGMPDEYEESMEPSTTS